MPILSTEYYKGVIKLKKVSNRNFNVDYFEKEKNIWIAESHIEDEPHSITLTLEIDMDKMIIINAKIKFNKFPMEHCTLIEDKASKLVGIKIDSDFIRNSMKIFMGPYGCPNIMLLLNISVPGIIYYYYPYKIKTGEMSHDEWNHMVKTKLKNACLSHTMLE